MNTLQYWQGRIDGTEQAYLRWHQIIRKGNDIVDYNQNFVILGFESDEGVRRNKGRIGARKAPNVIRQCCANFPVFHEFFTLFDAGNITCKDKNLEEAQEILAERISNIHFRKGKSLVFGGGHEVTFAHFTGLRKAFPNPKIGIINFDAHFDNREIETNIGASSGTGFYQIAEQETIHSLTIGIQMNSNTKALFNYADAKNMQYVLAEDLYKNSTKDTLAILNTFIQSVDVLYCTICMDVFASAFAPGVSATAYNGIIPDYKFMSIFKHIAIQPKLLAVDIAEVNPELDIDNRTAKLAASLVFELLKSEKKS